MENKKKVFNFLLKIKKYFKKINNNEIFFYSLEAKDIRSKLINDLYTINKEIKHKLKNKIFLKINDENKVNIINTSLSDNFKEAQYCLDILIKYLDKEKQTKAPQIKEKELIKIIKKGEDEYCEFKETIFFPTEESSIPQEKEAQIKNVRMEIPKAISAFANKKGGYLFIGIADSGEIKGIDKDMEKSFKEGAIKKNDIDKYILRLEALIKEHLSKSLLALIEIKICSLENKKVILIKVETSLEPIFMKGDKNKDLFYVRASNSSQELDIKESIKYIKKHWD